jgi:3-phosphoshikimate 1-carboxyvinyltransferase
MGCRVTWSKRRPADSVTVEGPVVRPVEADMGQMPDQVPTLAVVALRAGGVTRIRNVANLRLKESDRLTALASELRRVGAVIDESRDGLTIEPAASLDENPVTVATYGDHRIAMSFAILGCVRGGIAIENPGCVTKSYPGFWSALEAATGAGWLR